MKRNKKPRQKKTQSVWSKPQVLRCIFCLIRNFLNFINKETNIEKFNEMRILWILKYGLEWTVWDCENYKEFIEWWWWISNYDLTYTNVSKYHKVYLLLIKLDANRYKQFIAPKGEIFGDLENQEGAPN